MLKRLVFSVLSCFTNQTQLIMKKLYVIIPFLILLSGSVLAVADDSRSADGQKAENAQVPWDRVFFTVVDGAQLYSLDALVEIYEADIMTAKPEYTENLKNMWFYILNSRLVKEGSDDMKRRFLNEQIALKSNMPNYGGFYNLLRSCSSFMEADERQKIADEFYIKNDKFLKGIEWQDEKVKKNCHEGLVMAGRYHRMLSQSKK